jgi:antitoxin ParD1/3/4
MHVSLTPDLEGIVSNSLEAGSYDSPTEVIREALLLLQQRDADRQAMREHVLAQIAVGARAMERGEFGEYEDLEELVARIESEGRALLADRARGSEGR